MLQVWHVQLVSIALVIVVLQLGDYSLKREAILPTMLSCASPKPCL